ncbi:excinuclease ABC subunit UvrA [Coraliomargarita akajimensis]|uniref:UvrABC system protein A n=1 Tax=Coraliomargarita akajimensis (strain DSM 45221 / IAM 15411 / JCM 23193 / KCTC 12865 / 04OKA010-24) TaxID=583355 RepID=D5EKN0_CORAD|nr:excinuclease ABC subunit UvrA [Coraliomargarita akajimensis]ADE54937.1 excinuclease ABC, A subunit [Coraliomargarita akajimensis DSM 45221]
MPKAKDSIRLRGVRQNNLKGFDLDLPIGQLTVVTGLSGAGKSSLVFETLHAEGQRRYVETFSPYTRQFMELLDRPKVDSVENIRPSIAIQQSNTVKTSRSTVGTITELCDYFKVWFANVATLYDPATGNAITDDNPQSVWKALFEEQFDQSILVAFEINKPEKLSWDEILKSLSGQGYTRVIHDQKIVRISDLASDTTDLQSSVRVIQDRIAKLNNKSRSRTIEALQQAFTFGKGRIHLFDTNLDTIGEFTHGLSSPETGRTFRQASPPMFSFNSPIGACEKCRGFGRVIEIDYRLVIPNQSLSIDEGAIRAFQGEVYSESLRDLQRAAKKHKIRTNVPWQKLNQKELKFVMEGEPRYKEGRNQWYGVHRFFDWLNGNLYKMHVRVFLSKFRSYTECPDCRGSRLKPESLYWKWQGYTLPELYQQSVDNLLPLLSLQSPHSTSTGATPEENSALDGILNRLSFLRDVGLGYLTLDRSSRTLSGGETMRVNLTSCLGSALTDTLFVLDEPSVGLHPRDMDRLIAILQRLTDLGNTVVVVEHDEAVMRAADNLIEIGPEPGISGGQLIFHGPYRRILKSNTHTGRFLSGKDDIKPPAERRPSQSQLNTESTSFDVPVLSIYEASKHNIDTLSLHIPLQRFVCLSGVSGSGKSTLLNNVIYQNLLAQKGLAVEEPAAVKDLDCGLPLSEVVLIDQSPVSKTPRSNPASYTDAWNEIRKAFAQTEEAKSAGMGPGHFSFNSGDGRCPTCSGLGFERVEMQFVSDLFVPCETCEGRRFKDEVLNIEFNGRSIADILELDVEEALVFFADFPKIVRALQPVQAVGLGYLKLGQPLNTLSGGESQRLKLVSYLGKVSDKSGHALILIDEPTTGLHRADVKRLIAVLQGLVDAGHSLIVIEHNLDMLKVADWIIELGPEAGENGGQIIAQGTPEQIAQARCETARYLQEAMGGVLPPPFKEAQVAEAPSAYNIPSQVRAGSLTIKGAREHNLKNVQCQIDHNKMTVVTGVSGSGKSSLAFDIIFAEGQRRFMESMSAYARQFVEQMPRAEVDELHGIAPTVAIEQRVTKGTRKSTVATITEVAQYLRLMYARIGIQHSPTTGEAVVSQTEAALLKRLKTVLLESTAKQIYLCAPLIRGRKGHHEPLANWAREHGYEQLRIDGQLIKVEQFKKLDRYKEHDIDLVVSDLKQVTALKKELSTALRLGKGSVFLMSTKGTVLSWLSTKRTDPTTGEAYPELDPKHFSWNSPRGWCPTCRGYGQLFDWMAKDDDSDNPLKDRLDDFEHGDSCPDCQGTRLNELSRNVRLPFHINRASQKKHSTVDLQNTVSLPELLELTPSQLLTALKAIKTTARSKPILDELLPEIEERMRFMDRVGLDYLQLNRATATLSGGEAQRIRLAAQLGSNLSGVLYVLDEPSIGLHARDNERLIESLEQLRNRGNTLVIVEHDEDTMRHADKIIDLGPAAGIHGGEIVASGTLSQLKKNKQSITGKYLRQSMQHPLRGEYRELPPTWSPRKKASNENWISLQRASLRNLKGFDIQIPKQRLTAVCGVSGAGKSTLIRDLLKPLVESAIQIKSQKLTRKELPADSSLLASTNSFRALHGAETVRKVIEVDQSPIGKTPRSTPATYIGAFDIIRDIYASLPEARFRGYSAGTFSFNTKGGRCESCKGAGRVKLEMNFMPDTYVTCEDCNGRRYGRELDELQWNGKSIADVLAMSFEEAAEFFSFHTQLSSLMQLMVETGLGYITLGQYSPTLSGGEAQRMKLVSELAKGQPSFKERQYNKGQGNLYILEEPTIGLHLSDVERLIELLHRLVDKGHTVVVIEHHLDLIADADYLIEIGPDGGNAGGQLLHQGTVAGLHECAQSTTASFL